MFYRVPSGFRPDKTRAASFLNGFKTFLEKRVSREFITMITALHVMFYRPFDRSTGLLRNFKES